MLVPYQLGKGALEETEVMLSQPVAFRERLELADSVADSDVAASLLGADWVRSEGAASAAVTGEGAGERGVWTPW
jgi:hypothetical protein